MDFSIRPRETLAPPFRRTISVAPNLETRRSTWVPRSLIRVLGDATSYEPDGSEPDLNLTIPVSIFMLNSVCFCVSINDLIDNSEFDPRFIIV